MRKRKIRRSKVWTPVADLVDTFLERNDKKGSLSLVELWKHWDMVMGEDLREEAVPLAHKAPVLIIGAEDNLALQDLSFMVDEILERVNAFVGENLFKTVKLELLQGRVGLTRLANPPAKHGSSSVWASAAGKPAAYLPLIKAPSAPLGNLKIDEESDLGRCYTAYVRHFGQRGMKK